MAAEVVRRQTNDVGPVGREVAANLRRFRDARGLSTTQLSKLLAEQGRPIQPTGITKIEKGDRRVDVDDLVALATVLGVSPVALLLPEAGGRERVQLTQKLGTWAKIAWRWMHGELPLYDPEEEVSESRDEWQESIKKFIRENRPYEDSADLAMEAARFVRVRVGAPYSLTIEDDGETTTGSLNIQHRSVRRKGED
ncbi:helix-turn-helix domain-containing protein [Microbispora bryophytorum]|uniref:helix-turn-helix domain-containing protein n=1 Tax=Microbispora bryophytorum TaxID=1460882 RepID=UPI0033DB81FF